MSEMKRFTARRDAPSAPAEPTYNPLACSAWGCPLPGSIDIGSAGKFFCHCHAWAASKDWQTITGAIRAHQWLLEFTLMLRQLERKGDWRGMATRFWAEAEPEVMNPHPHENRDLYLYRLHLELEFRVGARVTRPGPMLPAQRGKPAGPIPGSLAAALPVVREEEAA